MSVQATSWVWDHSEATGSAFVVLLAVADAANADGERSCQSVETLASMARVSVRTVQRALRELEELGELENDGQDSRYASNTYRLPALAGRRRTVRPTPKSRGAKLSSLPTSGVTPVTPGVTNGAARGDIAVSPNPINPTLSNESDPTNVAPATASDAPDPFDTFWETYPRKVGKGQAVKAWRAATRTTAPEVILDGLRRHLPGLTAREGRFIPHPSTWLNGQRWGDELEAPTASDTRTVPTEHWDSGGSFFDGWRNA